MEIQRIENLNLTLRASEPQAYHQEIRKFNIWVKDKNQPLPDLIMTYFSELRKQGFKAMQVSKFALKKSILKKYGKDPVSVATIDSIFKKIKTPRKDGTIKAHDLLTKNELFELIKYADEKTGLIIQTLVKTGLRISELLSIRLSNCKPKEGQVYITVLGKGDKERQIFIENELFKMIRKTFKGKLFLFETRNGSKLNRSNVWRQISFIGDKINRPEIHPHTFRHTFATTVMQTASLKAVSMFLGHASVTTTAKFYIHDELKPDQINLAFQEIK